VSSGRVLADELGVVNDYSDAGFDSLRWRRLGRVSGTRSLSQHGDSAARHAFLQALKNFREEKAREAAKAGRKLGLFPGIDIDVSEPCSAEDW
jgi:hypothetical protein